MGKQELQNYKTLSNSEKSSQNDQPQPNFEVIKASTESNDNAHSAEFGVPSKHTKPRPTFGMVDVRIFSFYS